jgi:hypothetical protein
MAISEMEFKEDDSPLDISHKLKMLEIYNKRLDEVRACGVGWGGAAFWGVWALGQAPACACVLCVCDVSR